jgi:hypothetical protein
MRQSRLNAGCGQDWPPSLLHVGDFAVLKSDFHVFVDIDLLGAQVYRLLRRPQRGRDLIHRLADFDVNRRGGRRGVVGAGPGRGATAGFRFRLVGFLRLLVDLRLYFTLRRRWRRMAAIGLSVGGAFAAAGAAGNPP